MRSKRLWWRLFLSYLWVPIVVLLSIGLYGSHVVRQLYQDHLRPISKPAPGCAGKPIDELLGTRPGRRRSTRSARNWASRPIRGSPWCCPRAR